MSHSFILQRHLYRTESVNEVRVNRFCDKHGIHGFDDEALLPACDVGRDVVRDVCRRSPVWARPRLIVLRT